MMRPPRGKTSGRANVRTYVRMYVRMCVRMYVCVYHSCDDVLAVEEANFSRVINGQGILGNQESFLLLEKKKDARKLKEFVSGIILNLFSFLFFFPEEKIRLKKVLKKEWSQFLKILLLLFRIRFRFQRRFKWVKLHIQGVRGYGFSNCVGTRKGKRRSGESISNYVLRISSRAWIIATLHYKKTRSGLIRTNLFAYF